MPASRSCICVRVNPSFDGLIREKRRAALRGDTCPLIQARDVGASVSVNMGMG